MLGYSADYTILSLVGLSKRKKSQKPNCAEWQEKAESATESFATLVRGMKASEKMAEIDYYIHIYGTKDAVNMEELPSADVVERKQGKWNWVGFNIECSECGAMPNFDSTEPLYNFCPNCGSDNRGEK